MLIFLLVAVMILLVILYLFLLSPIGFVGDVSLKFHDVKTCTTMNLFESLCRKLPIIVTPPIAQSIIL